MLPARTGEHMPNGEVLRNVALMFLCYGYILLVILASSKIHQFFKVSHKASRKFLHAMIGNLPFVIPFFTANVYPVLVAAPFIVVTYFATPYSFLKSSNRALKGLADLTEEGHHFGLVFYAVAYTALALVFASQPYVIAAGILPMAYGDSLASVIGEKYSKRRYKVLAEKSLEGSAVMFFTSFVSFTLSLAFFSSLYSFQVTEAIVPALLVAAVATAVEALSPMGFDNLTVPVFSALTFWLFFRGL